MTQNTQTTEDRVYRIMLDNDTYARASRIIAAEIDRLTAERDEARVLADARVGDLMNANGVYIDELKAQLAEARAEVERLLSRLESERNDVALLSTEVERLRPAAEAWGTWEAWNRACNADPLPPPEVTRHLHREFWEAAARARAAKGGA